MSNHFSNRIALTIVLILALYASKCIGDDKILFPVDQHRMSLTIQDAAGQPIAGATVRPYAMRGQEEKGSHYGWPAENVGPEPEVISDQNGKVEFDYPVRFGRPSRWLTTAQISVDVTHAKYSQENTHIEVSDVRPIVMQSGCALAISAIDDQQKPLINFVPLFGQRASAGAVWEATSDGIQTGGAGVGAQQLLLACPHDNGFLFSDLLEVVGSLDKPEKLERIPMRRGVTLKGQLPDYVPRPIENGLVRVLVYPKIEIEKPRNGEAPYWNTETQINPDGTFEFASLPRCGEVQIVAVCRGWIVKTEGKVDFFIRGHHFALDGKGEMVNKTLEMEPAGSIKLKVIDPYGEPASGIQLLIYPNLQSIEGWSSGLFDSFKSEDWVIQMLAERKGKKRERFRWSYKPGRYIQNTDSDGIAVLRDVPLFRRFGVNMADSSSTTELPVDPETKRREFRFQLDSEEQVETEIYLEKAITVVAQDKEAEPK